MELDSENEIYRVIAQNKIDYIDIAKGVGKNNLKQFPLNLLKKIITDDFYLNVNVTVNEVREDHVVVTLVNSKGKLLIVEK